MNPFIRFLGAETRGISCVTADQVVKVVFQFGAVMG